MVFVLMRLAIRPRWNCAKAQREGKRHSKRCFYHDISLTSVNGLKRSLAVCARRHSDKALGLNWLIWIPAVSTQWTAFGYTVIQTDSIMA